VVGGYSSVTGLDERLKSRPPPRTYRPLRQIVVYLCITYGLTLAIALALPHAGIAPLIAICRSGGRGCIETGSGSESDLEDAIDQSGYVRRGLTDRVR
jgi:hypothetical protein